MFSSRMIRDAAKFDRRMNGVRPYSERQERFESPRLRSRYDRVICAFEISQPGNGGYPLSAAVGGSGKLYSSIQSAIDNESSSEVVFVPQAGTTSGVVVLPAGMSGGADAYKDYYVVNTSASPSCAEGATGLDYTIEDKTDSRIEKASRRGHGFTVAGDVLRSCGKNLHGANLSGISEEHKAR